MAQPDQAVQREIMRGVMQNLWEHIVRLDDAPEGIELFRWTTLPFVDGYSVTIPLPPEPASAAAAGDEIPVETPEPPTLTLRRWRSGTVKLKTNKGDVEIPWWCGVNRYEREAVLCCGPR